MEYFFTQVPASRYINARDNETYDLVQTNMVSLWYCEHTSHNGATEDSGLTTWRSRREADGALSILQHCAVLLYRVK